MPIHDWTRVPGNFYDFHLRWTAAIRNLLNDELPSMFYSMLELPESAQCHDEMPSDRIGIDYGYDIADQKPSVRFEEKLDEENFVRVSDHVTIFQELDDRPVAYIEIVAPWNKQSDQAVWEFRHRVRQTLHRGCHFMMIDILPAGRHDPFGMHRECWDYNQKSPCVTIPDEPFGFASYVAAEFPHAYFDRAGLGQPVPSMPLFLTKERYVNVPLEDAYNKAWKGVPERWRSVLAATIP